MMPLFCTADVTEDGDRRLVLEKGQLSGLDMSTITRIVTENSLVKLKELIDVNASGNDILSSEHQLQVCTFHSH